VLDVGAGTGFLSLLLAAQGYRVTALDLAPGMLELLGRKAERLGLAVSTVEASASNPPLSGFDAVVERHLLWTMPEPRAALDAWRSSCPFGTLALFESAWGPQNGATARVRTGAAGLLRRARRRAPDHHAEYDQSLRARLPLGAGSTPERLVAEVAASAWGPPRIRRLRDVEWAMRVGAPSVPDRLVGVAPRFVLTAG
jgi:SAM-dependent methyltransferase